MVHDPASAPRSFCGALVRLAFIAIVLAPATHASQITVSDPFTTQHTYWNGTSVNVAGTIWDGMLNTQNATAVTADIAQAWRLVLAMNTNSSRSDPTYSATTLYLDVAGDFDARVQIPSFQANENFENQGIVADAGQQDLLEVLNIINNSGLSRFRGYTNGLQTNFVQINDQQSWLRLTREGDSFQGFYGSDGAAWTAYGAAVTRTDLAGVSLRVGLFAATTNTSGNFQAEFDNFSIVVVPEPCGMFLVAAGGFAVLLWGPYRARLRRQGLPSAAAI